MGIGPVALNIYDQLKSKGVMHSGQSICELGSQGMATDKDPLPQSARDYMRGLGFDYVSIDIDGAFGALRLDLNEVNQCDIGREFDIVTNHGTTEHLFDQRNCFEVMHDLTKVGGIMIHVVPSGGYRGHCFYIYNVGLFEDIAKANDYEIIHVKEHSDPQGMLLGIVMRKTMNGKFKVPIQSIYGGVHAAE